MVPGFVAVRHMQALAGYEIEKGVESGGERLLQVAVALNHDGLPGRTAAGRHGAADTEILVEQNGVFGNGPVGDAELVGPDQGREDQREN